LRGLMDDEEGWLAMGWERHAAQNLSIRSSQYLSIRSLNTLEGRIATSAFAASSL